MRTSRESRATTLAVIGRARTDLSARPSIPGARSRLPVRMSSLSYLLAHRACLYGPGSVRENSRTALAAAVGKGFGVECDVGCDESGRLTLAHAPEPWDEEIDAEAFLRNPGPGLH